MKKEHIAISILILIILGFLTYVFWFVPFEKQLINYGAKLGVDQIVNQVRQTGNVIIMLTDGSKILLVETPMSEPPIDPSKLQGIK